MKCSTCRYFSTKGDTRDWSWCSWLSDPPRLPLGTCMKWMRGYNVDMSDIPMNGVLVEDDEGWGNVVGPDFGCVLWEKRE